MGYCPEKMRETGLSETKVSQRGRKQVLKQSDITINEINEKLQLSVSDETVCKSVLKLGYIYKKKSLHTSEQERPPI